MVDKKSDQSIVAEKVVKATGAKGLEHCCAKVETYTAQGGRIRMLTKTEEVRKMSERHAKVQNLMYLVNEVNLLAAHRSQPKGKAEGVDGVSKEIYDANAQDNLANLVDRLKKFSYRPKPTRRTYIPKANGKMRPLGIPSYEDKIVQAVMADILNCVYEPRFLECSHGFRPKRNAHDVVKQINNGIRQKPVNWILEADIKAFFDNLDHDWLMKFLEHDIEDKNFLRYIKRFLSAGVMEGAEFTPSDKGSVQGGLCRARHNPPYVEIDIMPS